MDSTILDQLNNLEKEVDSEVIKTKSGRKIKTDTKTFPTINEEEGNDIRDKRDRLVACISYYLVTQNNIYEKNTLNSKLIKWISITSIYCQIDTNPS